MDTNSIAKLFYEQRPTTSRFITAKQAAWLFQQADKDNQLYRGYNKATGSRGCAKGSFNYNGSTIFWQANLLKGGAANFSVEIPKPRDYKAEWYKALNDFANMCLNEDDLNGMEKFRLGWCRLPRTESK